MKFVRVHNGIVDGDHRPLTHDLMLIPASLKPLQQLYLAVFPKLTTSTMPFGIDVGCKQAGTVRIN